jgi:hypothetical protein
MLQLKYERGKTSIMMREAMLRSKSMEAKKQLVLDNLAVDKASSSKIRLQLAWADA